MAIRHQPARIAIVGLLLLAAATPTTRPSGDDLNAAVLKYAAAQVGKTVGNGECWTLAAEALRAAGARRARGYTYGRKLAAGEAVRPGDIMQFTSCVFRGSDAHHWWTISLGFPHHTAVVKAVLNVRKYQIYQQNPGPVNVITINFNELKSGTYEVWRAVPRGGATTAPAGNDGVE